MKEIHLDKLKNQIPERDFDILHANDPWFRLSHKAGYAKGLWNFTVALMDSECESLEVAYKVAEESNDLTHLCGFHKLRFRQSRWEEMRWFFTRVWHNKAILNLKPELKDYIEFVCENSRVPNGKVTRPLGLLRINNDGDGALQRLPWRTPEWYRAQRGARPRTPRIVRPRLPPMTEFWPYISSQPTEDHGLLLAVDRLVPRGLNEQVRADVCQDMMVSILSGEITLDNLQDSRPEYLKKMFKGLPSKYGHLSLETTVFSDSKLVLADMIV